MKTNPIPNGYHTITPYLILEGASEAIEFYKKVFGATERMRIGAGGGKIGHAELQIGDSMIMLADENPEIGARSPKQLGGSPVSMHMYVSDVDAVVARATEAGAKLERAVETKFYGDRSGGVVDPWGHRWYVSTHVEDVSLEEMQRRMTKFEPAGP